MKPRELGGHLRKGAACYVYVQVNRHGHLWMQVPKSFVRDLIDDAKEDGFDVIRATYNKKKDEVEIGGPVEGADEANAAEPLPEGTEEEEEEEEEDLDEEEGEEDDAEEEEEEEEETP